MILQQLVVPTMNTLASQYQKNRLLLIHPESRNRTLLLAALLGAPPCPLYYHQLEAIDTRLSLFLTGLSYGLAGQTPGFGYHLNPVLRETPDDIAALASALSQDLAELNQKDYLLILDDFDHCDPALGLEPFFSLLLDDLPAACHLLIYSRTIPALPWIALIARGRAMILRDGRPSTHLLAS